MTFIDVFQGRHGCIYVKVQQRVFWEVQWVQGACENAIGAQNQDIQSDNGGEYISKAFKQFLKDHGIEKQILTPYRLKHNGVAKRIVSSWRCHCLDALDKSTYPADFVDCCFTWSSNCHYNMLMWYFLLHNSPWGVSQIPWAQGKPRNDTWDLWHSCDMAQVILVWG